MSSHWLAGVEAADDSAVGVEVADDSAGVEVTDDSAVLRVEV